MEFFFGVALKRASTISSCSLLTISVTKNEPKQEENTFSVKPRPSLVFQCRLKLLVHLPWFRCSHNADSICDLTAVNNNYGWGKNKLSSFSMADGSVKYMHRAHNDLSFAEIFISKHVV